MCEINFLYGLNKKLSEKEITEFRRMMKISSFTNNDGWGIFNDKGLICKKPEKFDEKLFGEISEKLIGSTFVVGHCRYATKGEKKKKNTHPFEYQNLIIVHNGVICNDNEIREKFDFPKYPDVDSFVIANLISTFIENKKNEGTFQGKDENYLEIFKNVADELDGTYSVFVYDKNTSKLFYMRNSQDFTFALLEKDNNHIIIGSTSESNINQSFSKYHYGFYVSDTKIESILEPEINAIYRIGKFGIRYIGKIPEKPKKYSIRKLIKDTNTWSDEIDAYQAELDVLKTDVKILYLDQNDRFVITGKKFIREFQYYLSEVMNNGETAIITKDRLNDLIDDMSYVGYYDNVYSDDNPEKIRYLLNNEHTP